MGWGVGGWRMCMVGYKGWVCSGVYYGMRLVYLGLGVWRDIVWGMGVRRDIVWGMGVWRDIVRGIAVWLGTV